MNIGTGRGTSVLELIHTFERVNKVKVNYKIGKRRKGDIPICFADTKLSKKLLKWQPRYDIESMCKHAWSPYK